MVLTTCTHQLGFGPISPPSSHKHHFTPNSINGEEVSCVRPHNMSQKCPSIHTSSINNVNDYFVNSLPVKALDQRPQSQAYHTLRHGRSRQALLPNPNGMNLCDKSSPFSNLSGLKLSGLSHNLWSLCMAHAYQHRRAK